MTSIRCQSFSSVVVVVAPFVSNFISISQFIARNSNDKEMYKKRQGKKKRKRMKTILTAFALFNEQKPGSIFCCVPH